MSRFHTFSTLNGALY
ncbi:hypothetical protein AZE42_06014 [Rhizopogon vesiculosus]|uniref:Uncharacterized protein n=1 Tax=Rhizopogon vesiculosus TaxID=180088 RepID=A0A1J8QBA4_9AGAM|nr:hypothetical protein AZE42_06014 [Rhizopogon vesiculosus]